MKMLKQYLKGKIDNILITRYEKITQNAKRIMESKVEFEKCDIVTNLYVDDKLDYGGEIVLYDVYHGVENCFTYYFSKNSIPLINKRIDVIGYIETEYWDKKNKTVKIDKIHVYEDYRQKNMQHECWKDLLSGPNIVKLKELN